MIAPYPYTKILQAPQLKLLDRALAPSKFRRDLTQTLLTDEPSDYHPPLIRWQRFDELVKQCPLLDVVFHADLFHVVRHDFLLPSKPLPVVRKHARRNPQKPCHDRQATPFELPKATQSLVKDFRSHILCFFAVSHATCDVGVDAFKIVLIQFGKSRWILLRRLDR